jgi:hypothetical protein
VLLKGILFSIDGFVTSLLKSPFNQMCYAINQSKLIVQKEKDLLITMATESNEHCKETLKKFGVISLISELFKAFIETGESKKSAAHY